MLFLTSIHFSLNKTSLIRALVSVLIISQCIPCASYSASPDPFKSPKSQAFNSIQPLTMTLGDVKGRLESSASLEPIDININQDGDILLRELPNFKSEFSGHFAGLAKNGGVVLYSLDPELQSFVTKLVNEAKAPHIAVVAMEPDTGRVLAMGGRSTTIGNPVFHSGFPAASLFKVVTTAATLEQTPLEPETVVRFRGSPYTLERWNYLPDNRRDRRMMTLTEALGKSCNAVFGRVARFLNQGLLKQYAHAFGFNSKIGFERPLPVSTAEIPDDSFELSRTAAGFGEVTISPIHAATLMAGVANGGLMLRPTLVDKVFSRNGILEYQTRPETLQRMVKPQTANTLMDMMVATTTTGTSRKAFMYKKRPLLGDIEVAAKTGTLSGDNPKGLNHWFIAAAPKNAPKIAIAVIVVDPRAQRFHANRIGREVIEHYLR